MQDPDAGIRPLDGGSYIDVDLRRLDHYLRRHSSSWNVDRVDDSNLTFSEFKYARLLDAVNSGNSLKRPVLERTGSGQFHVGQGRHRLYALIDSGYEVVSVCVEKCIGDLVQDAVGYDVKSNR